MPRWLIPFFLLFLSISVYAIEELPLFREGPCSVTPSRNYDVLCGTINVPEMREQPSGKTLTLSIMVYKSRAAQPLPDPIIYLEGGPGADTLVSADIYMQYLFDSFLDQRDVIFFDQRGTGYSTFNLSCPELKELAYEILGLPASPELDDEILATSQACRDRLVSEGANLAAYRTRENAADVADVIRALGYEQVNLYGASYGSRLGLTVLRDHPQLIRSAVFDGLYPPNIESLGDGLLRTQELLDKLFADCAASSACSLVYPDLEDTFYSLVSQLAERPAVVQNHVDEYTGRTVDILFDDATLVNVLASAFYLTDLIPELPTQIIAATQGDLSFFVELVMFNLYTLTDFSDGMYSAVTCAEETAFFTEEDLAMRVSQLSPALREIALREYPLFAADCALWADLSAPDPRDDEPVISDKPVLLLSGDYDIATPPAWGDVTLSTLSNGQHFIFAGRGHVVSFEGGCFFQIVFDYFDDPTAPVDTTCVEQATGPFVVRELVTDIQIMPYTNRQLGITGVTPDGWQEIDAGVLTPDIIDEVPLLAYRLPESFDEYAERIFLGAYGYIPDPVRTTTYNDRAWTFYELENGPFISAFATAEVNGQAVVIAIVTSSPEERSYLMDALLIPAIQAFTLE